MKLYIDNKGRIKAVKSTECTDLIAINVDDNDPTMPFHGWSEARICCYKIGYYYEQVGTEEQEIENFVTGELENVEVPVYSEYATINMFTPYIPTHMMSAIEQLEKENTELRALQEENDTELLYQICLLQLGITEEEM